MDMRNVAVGVVMEVIATTMVPLVPEEETISPMLFQDNTAVVADCPTDLGTGLFMLPVDQCERPMSGDVGALARTAVAV